MYKNLALLLLTMSFINCLSTGNFVSKEKLNQIVEKKSTRSDVKSTLGSPTSTEMNGDLTVYSYNGCKSNGIYGFPIFGLIFGSYECNRGTIVIDKDDKVKDKTFDYSKTGYW